MTKGARSFIMPPKHQLQTTVNQAAAVQNTWYTLLNTTRNVRIIQVGVAISIANETLQLRITVDGQALVGEQAAVFGTVYIASLNYLANSLNMGTADTRPFMMEGRNVKIEMRKTTATGAGTLTGVLLYQTW